MDPQCNVFRWAAKKAARHGLVAASGLRPRAGASPGVRVLTYHRFGDSSRDPFCVSRPTFDRQMRFLAENRLAVGLDEVEDLLSGSPEVRRGGVLVTIDDGCRSTLTEALPVLRHWGIPAVAYVVVGSLGQGRGIDLDQPEDYLTWDELEELADGGVTIGSHAVHHRSLGQMTESQARAETLESRQLLETHLDLSVQSFAYPFGTRSDYDATTRRALAAAGYTTGFTSQHGAVRPSDDPLELPRVKVEGGEGMWMFERLCAGGMDGWALVDRVLPRLQRPAVATHAVAPAG